MKITFVRPNVMYGIRGDALEPLVFAILASLSPPDVEHILYDDRIEVIPFDEPTDLVALTVETFAAKRAYQIASQYHNRGIPVVMGGNHPTLNPNEALAFATSIVIGDAEGVWKELVNDARRGTLKRIYKNRYPPLNGLRPDREVFKGKRYNNIALAQFGRGCRFNCDFCSIHAFYGKNTRQRPIQELVSEIEQAGRKYVFFTDDNLFIDLTTTKELLAALKSLGVRWVCQVSLDTAANKELVHLMAQSGCIIAAIGFESLNEENLQQMRKSWNLAHGNYEELIRVFYDNGIMIYAGFLFGYDGDTTESFKITLDFALRSKFFTANFNPLAPIPGTALYKRLHQEGRLINDPWWLHSDFRWGQCMFHPRGMTAQQLTDGCYNNRSQFHRYNNILRRALNLRVNCRNIEHFGLYLALNWISRREIHYKQGKPLGEGDELEPLFPYADEMSDQLLQK